TLMKYLRGAMASLARSKAVPKSRFTRKDRDGGESYLTWYQATRHTFASHYMMAGGNVAKLQAELGHSDIQTTQRYAKLAPDYRTAKDRQLIRLPKVRGEGKIVAFPTAVGSKLVAKAKAEKHAKAVTH
ncbi:MAG: integrase family protein, partial [bacterium]|nr:integrase family protein [bacterium]